MLQNTGCYIIQKLNNQFVEYVLLLLAWTRLLDVIIVIYIIMEIRLNQNQKQNIHFYFYPCILSKSLPISKNKIKDINFLFKRKKVFYLSHNS